MRLLQTQKLLHRNINISSTKMTSVKPVSIHSDLPANFPICCIDGVHSDHVIYQKKNQINCSQYKLSLCVQSIESIMQPPTIKRTKTESLK